jgi:hypothetical protein
VAGALQILRGGSLWLSSTASLNDHAEGQWLLQLLQEREVDRSRQLGARPLEEQQALWPMLGLLFNAGAAQAYVACFSEDGDLLSQWRAYGTDGQGVAIGFDPNDGRMPIIDSPPFSNAARERAVSLVKVDYVGPGDLASLFEHIDRAVTTRELADLFALQLRLSALRWVAKNPAFAEEQEWRLVNLPLQAGDPEQDAGWLSEIGARQFRASGGRLISYYELPFGPAAVRELVLGPRSELDHAELAIFLQQAGLSDIKVRTSAATYRA